MSTLVDKYFSSLDLKAIEEAVRKAESSTCGEIVVSITSHSRHWLWERVEFSAAIGALIMLLTLWITRQNDWGVYYNFSQALLYGIIGFALAYLVSKPLLMRRERTRKVVWKHALQHFHRLTPTKGKTGVLIFVSVEENQAAVIADTGIASKLPAEHWHSPHKMIIDGARAGKHAEGIIAAIESIGTELASHFPIQGDDVDELPNSVEIDPH